MRYSNEITINLPVFRVVELFDNTENLKKWQPGLQSFEHLSGEAGKAGAKSRLKFLMGKREVEMIETIVTANFPHDFSGSYEAKDVYNLVKNSFIEKDSSTTIWKTENEFKMSGFMKIIAFLFPGSFKKQTQKYLEYFKEFAENEG